MKKSLEISLILVCTGLFAVPLLRGDTAPVLKTTVGDDVSVKGVKPGELYSVGLSMKRLGAGVVFASVRFKSNGKTLGAKKAIAMNSPFKDDVWRSGEAVVRVQGQ